MNMVHQVLINNIRETYNSNLNIIEMLICHRTTEDRSRYIFHYMQIFV